MKKIWLYILVIIAFTGCQVEVDLGLEGNNPIFVIEGLITDQPGPHTIKLTTSGNYYDNGATPRIANEDATVVIMDDMGKVDTLFAEEDGFFKTDSLFQCVLGRTYSLSINYQGQEYYASEELIEIYPIDSLVPKYFEPQSVFEGIFMEEGYYLYFFGKTDKEQVNYYRFITTKNDTVYNEQFDFNVTDDAFINDTITDWIYLQEAFKPGDVVKLDVYGLTENVYDYYIQFVMMLFNDGGMFSPPPQNPRANIKNLTNPSDVPLGYFQVSMVKTITVEIPDEVPSGL